VNTETHQIIVHGMTVEVVRKAIKNLHLAVYPPHGRVRVAVPLAIDDEAVRLAVVTRLGWIKRQQAKFREQARQSEREAVSGETHYFLGQRYRLHLHEGPGPSRVALRGKTILDLHARPGATAEERELIIHRWYRAQLKLMLPPLIEKWEKKLGVQVTAWGIKKMKTKWGTCNPEARRVWFNLELAKKPERCLEYLVVHELLHLLERKHNDFFKALLDRHYPHWRSIRDELNQTPLGHEKWNY